MYINAESQASTVTEQEPLQKLNFLTEQVYNLPRVSFEETFCIEWNNKVYFRVTFLISISISISVLLINM